MYIYKRVLGWGLNNIRLDENGLINDLRINSDSPILPDNELKFDQNALLHTHYERVMDKPKIANLMKDELDFILCKGSRGELALADAITYDSHLPHSLLITPLHIRSSWVRDSDPMDMVRDYFNAETATESQCQLLPDAPAPYGNKFINKLDKFSWLDGKLAHKWRRAWIKQQEIIFSHINDDIDENCENELEDLENELEMLSCILGFSSTEQAAKGIQPAPPAEVIEIVKTGKLFSHLDVVTQLQPYFYTLRYNTESSSKELVKQWRNVL